MNSGPLALVVDLPADPSMVITGAGGLDMREGALYVFGTSLAPPPGQQPAPPPLLILLAPGQWLRVRQVPIAELQGASDPAAEPGSQAGQPFVPLPA